MIPLQTDRPLRTTPFVNYALISLNVLIFVAVGILSPEGRAWVDINFNLYPNAIYYTDVRMTAEPHVYQYITSVFLHGGFMHLAGNMLFLWVFGNLVEDKFGHVGYLFFYLTGGVVAGIGHSLVETSPAIGASGAISAVTGAFLVLFPQTRIRILWLLFIITIIDIPSLWFIGFSIARDVFMQLAQADRGIAYMAHIAGSICGISAGFVVLGFRILPREPYDMLTMITQWNRRRQFRAVTRQGYDPWRGMKSRESSAFQKPEARRQTKKDDSTGPDDPAGADHQSSTSSSEMPGTEIPEGFDAEKAAIRLEISEAVAQGDMSTATTRYRALIKELPDLILSETVQLQVANQLFTESDHELAATAYERLLSNYPGCDTRGEIRLMLGVALSRYLDRPDEAKPYLEQAITRLRDGENKTLAESLLESDEKPADEAPTPAESP